MAYEFTNPSSDSTKFVPFSQESLMTEIFALPIEVVKEPSSKSSSFKRECETNDKRSYQNRRNRKEPVVKPGCMLSNEIKRRTSFEDERVLLSYIAIICNGDAETMFSSETTLTWFEEWMLYFEVLWGRTWTRYEDMMSAYNITNEKISMPYSMKNARLL